MTSWLVPTQDSCNNICESSKVMVVDTPGKGMKDCMRGGPRPPMPIPRPKSDIHGRRAVHTFSFKEIVANPPDGTSDQSICICMLRKSPSHTVLPSAGETSHGESWTGVDENFGGFLAPPAPTTNKRQKWATGKAIDDVYACLVLMAAGSRRPRNFDTTSSIPAKSSPSVSFTKPLAFLCSKWHHLLRNLRLRWP